MTNTFQEITRQALLDIGLQLADKMRYTLLNKGFDVDIHDTSRVSVIKYDHYDILDELWLDGSVVAKWSRFSFKQDGEKLIGSFEYIEV